MSGWTVPQSSSPQLPSTPGHGQRHANNFTKSPNGIAKNPFAPNPSTTPAGPPPSSAASFTPADPPPSSIFGSSQLGSGKTLFKSKGSYGANTNSRKNAHHVSPNSIDQKKLARFLDKTGGLDLGESNGTIAKNKFDVPSSSPLHSPSSGEEEEYEAFEEDHDAERSAEDDLMDSRLDDQSFDLGSAISSIPKRSLASGNPVLFGSSLINATPRGIKRAPRGSKSLAASPRTAKKPSKQKHESAIPRIAKNIATRIGIALLKEKDDFIVGTENVIQHTLYNSEIPRDRHDQALELELSTASESLKNLWQLCYENDLANLPSKQESYKVVGPDEHTPLVHKATFLASLLLQIHHPPVAKGKQALALSRFDETSIQSKSAPPKPAPLNPTAFPRILVDWLSKSHDPYGLFHLDVLKYRPNPTAHPNYWNLIFSFTLRGKLVDVINLFKASNFNYAITATDDRRDSNGYSAVQIRNIERAINLAIQALETCPALQEDNWNVTWSDWMLFRKQIEQTRSDLAIFAEGRDRSKDPVDASFEASNFGLQSTAMRLSSSTRKAESQVPWAIYESLQSVYGIVLGETDEILAMAQDWVEATIGMTIWWDGNEDEEVAVGSVALARRSLRQSESKGTRLVDVNSNAAYLRRLAYAFNRVDAAGSKEQGPTINTLNPIEVALASVFLGNLEDAMAFLRAWSLPVACAVTEVGNAGGWLDALAGIGITNGLDEDDLIVLNEHVPKRQLFTRDAILTEYAKALAPRENIRAVNEKTSFDGWELSITILNRLDDGSVAAKEVAELLEQLPEKNDLRMDKILRIGERFHITAQTRHIAEQHADDLIDTSLNYGKALIYYARAHHQQKMKNVLDFLISRSVVESTAFPALAALDPSLHAFIFEPQQSLDQIAIVDPKAAEMLHTYLAGYASLRRFYDLRDAEVQLEDDKKPKMRPVARRIAAATALLAVVSSAADNIHGGLYDESRGAVVQVDGLLVLLGEAMMFVDQPGHLLPQAQCFILLKAIEDLETVTPRVYAQCEECFKATLAAYHSSTAPASPRGILQKSMSDLTHSFSVISESMAHSEASDVNGTGSKAMVDSEQEKEGVRRAWDWRKGFGEKTCGEEALRVLRLGLARDIAKHWVAGEGL